MLLASAGGNRVPVIAQLVQADEDTVRDVIHRFNEIGLTSLAPRWAGGLPRLLSSDDEDFVIRTATTLPAKVGRSFTRWSLRILAAYLRNGQGRIIHIGRARPRPLPTHATCGIAGPTHYAFRIGRTRREREVIQARPVGTTAQSQARRSRAPRRRSTTSTCCRTYLAPVGPAPAPPAPAPAPNIHLPQETKIHNNLTKSWQACGCRPGGTARCSPSSTQGVTP